MQANTSIPLEPAVMRLLLAGDDPVLGILREQFHHAKLLSREFTGVGFLHEFCSAGCYPAITRKPQIFLRQCGGCHPVSPTWCWIPTPGI